MFPQERQREARARKQRMLEMEVEAKKKALKSDIEARTCMFGYIFISDPKNMGCLGRNAFKMEESRTWSRAYGRGFYQITKNCVLS